MLWNSCSEPSPPRKLKSHVMQSHLPTPLLTVVVTILLFAIWFYMQLTMKHLSFACLLYAGECKRYTCPCVHICRPEIHFSAFLNSCWPWFLRQGFSMNPEFDISARLTDQQATIIHLPLSPQCWGYRCVPPCRFCGSELMTSCLCHKHFNLLVIFPCSLPPSIGISVTDLLYLTQQLPSLAMFQMVGFEVLKEVVFHCVCVTFSLWMMDTQVVSLLGSCG